MEPSFHWINFFKGFNEIVVIRMETLLTIVLYGFPLPLKVYRRHAQTAEVMEPSFCLNNFFQSLQQLLLEWKYCWQYYCKSFLSVLRGYAETAEVMKPSLHWINCLKAFNKMLMIGRMRLNSNFFSILPRTTRSHKLLSQK